jgi:carboxylate-amine ligase
VLNGSTARPEHRLFPRAPRRKAREPELEALFSRFDGVSPFTLGVEEELLVVDAQDFDLLPAGDRVLAALAGRRCFGPEFRACQVELSTPVCDSVPEVAAALSGLRAELDAVREPGMTFIAAGTHPCALPGPVSDGLRYRRIASQCRWATQWMLTCGMHVHVAVPGPERALAVYNTLRSYLPLISALGVNSPFHLGRESGVSSVRTQLNATLPRAGVPPAFASLADYASFVAWGSAGSVIPDLGQLWWDLRLSCRFGTIEVRVADVQTRTEDAAALAALVQSLVAWLVRRYDEGECMRVEPGERIQENAWLASRDGTSRFLVDLESGARRPTGELIGALVSDLMPVAAELGCAEQLADVLGLAAETGAAEQRRVHACSGMGGLLSWLAETTLASCESDGLDALLAARPSQLLPVAAS